MAFLMITIMLGAGTAYASRDVGGQLGSWYKAIFQKATDTISRDTVTESKRYIKDKLDQEDEDRLERTQSLLSATQLQGVNHKVSIQEHYATYADKVDEAARELTGIDGQQGLIDQTFADVVAAQEAAVQYQLELELGIFLDDLNEQME